MKWISVKDRLPDKDDWVLIFSEENEVETSYYRCGSKTFSCQDDVDLVHPTHWMPLPKQPND